jgi:hypothetical protein
LICCLHNYLLGSLLKLSLINVRFNVRFNVLIHGTSRNKSIIFRTQIISLKSFDVRLRIGKLVSCTQAFNIILLIKCYIDNFNHALPNIFNFLNCRCTYPIYIVLGFLFAPNCDSKESRSSIKRSKTASHTV